MYHLSMVNKSQAAVAESPLVQIGVNFVLPAIILTRFSSSLGAGKAMLLALAFPVAFELYSMRKRRKSNMLSLLAIGGILVTGLISLLGLSENWLALRRSVPYVAIALAIVAVLHIKRSLIFTALNQLIDMDKVTAAAGKNKTLPKLERHITRAVYSLAVLFVLVAVASYVLTLVVITAPTDTAAFNSEYVRLRVITIPAVMLPLLVGCAGVLLYLLSKIEKLTGIESTTLFKKK